jgi:hypothetical protein
VIHHDAEILLATQGEIYCMPTAGEQEQFMQIRRNRGMIQEGHHA